MLAKEQHQSTELTTVILLTNLTVAIMNNYYPNIEHVHISVYRMLQKLLSDQLCTVNYNAARVCILM